MKIPKIVFYTVIASMMILTTTCSKQKWFSYITYQGNVYDIISHQPKPGVVVHLQTCGGGNGDQQTDCANWKTDIGTSSTDGNGHFYIHTREARSGSYWVNVNGNYVNSLSVNAPDLNSTGYTQLYY